MVLLVLAQRKPVPCLAWGAMLVGSLIFSGSLHVLAVTNLRWLGAITPIGGVAILVGWFAILWKPLAGLKHDEEKRTG